MFRFARIHDNNHLRVDDFRKEVGLISRKLRGLEALDYHGEFPKGNKNGRNEGGKKRKERNPVREDSSITVSLRLFYHDSFIHLRVLA